MPVDARRLVRKMRGGAQAHLLEASDSRYYVVKFSNNPQHRRILVNEWIASVFLRHLGLASPEPAMIRITEEFLACNPDTWMQLGRQRQEPVLGWHFGSTFPGDPSRNTVYDFLPDALLGKVENLREFIGVLAFDKWAGNADSRQAIFYRARVTGGEAGTAPARHPTSSASLSLPAAPGSVVPANSSMERLGFVAQMVDNGYVFDGPHWRLRDSPLQGLYFRPMVYADVRGWADFEPWLDRIRHFPGEIVDQAIKQIPPPWLEGEGEELERLLDRLLARRKRVGDLLLDCRAGRMDPFPAWPR